MSPEFTLNVVRAGVHPFSVAAICEHGRICASDDASKGHEYTTPGVYTCPLGETTPFQYATPSYIEA
eukprot:5586456-Alexandrium_andersonii.AAC.1